MLSLVALVLAAASAPTPATPLRPGPEFFAAHRQRVLDRLPAGAVAVSEVEKAIAGR